MNSHAFHSLRTRLLLLATIAVVALLSIPVLDGSPADAQVTPALTAVPSSLTIPIGSRACYVIKPSTLPTHDLSIRAIIPNALDNKATVTSPHLQTSENWVPLGVAGGTSTAAAARKIGVPFCVKGTAAGTGAIRHTVSSTDTNYNNITTPSVTVTVTAADSKPTVRFLHSEMRVVEGDTTTPGSRNIHDLSSRVIKVKLDIAPAPTSSGVISIYIPASGRCGVIGCLIAGSEVGTASEAVDVRTPAPPDIQVPYTSNSNDMEFTFQVISDNSSESDEWLKMYLIAEWFEPSHSSANGMGFVANTDVCIGACTSPTLAQRTTTVTIIDDDGSDHVDHPWAQMGAEVGTYRPDGSRVWGNIGLVTTEEDNKPSQDQNQEQEEDDTPNRAPTVAAEFSDVTIVSESGTEDVLLFFISDNSPSPVFADADGDDLTITAASSDEDVATASVASRSTLKVSAKSRGTATITVTADDGEGGTVSDAFDVTVKAAPTVASGLSDVSGLEAGTAKEVSLSGVFSDPDGDALEIDAISSDDDVATVAVALDYSKLTVTGVAEGKTTITVLATDSDGNLAGDSFDVSVSASQPILLVPPAEQQPSQNQEVVKSSPQVASQLVDVSGLGEGATREVSLSGAFSDADGDALTITASSDADNVATVSVASNYSSLTLTGVSSGDATITVVAQDPDGSRALQTFDVEVTDPAPQQQQSQAQQPIPTPAPTPEAEAATDETEAVEQESEPETTGAVERYDTNGNGFIEYSEYIQAANDYFDGKIAYAEMLEVAEAYEGSSG